MAKILVVDDEPDMIWAITNVLLTQNHSVISVSSGEDAIQKVQEVFLDLVLLDYRLPGMDGVQILEKIKQLKPDLPVIMVTGFGGIEEAIQSIKLGAAHYLAKPFDNDHLIEVTNKALQLNSLKKEGVFGKRIVEKFDPKSADAKPALSQVESSPPIQKRSKAYLWIIPALLLVAAGGLAGRWYHKKAIPQEFMIPHSRVSGLSWGTDQLWACDWFTQSVYQYEFKNDHLNLVKSFTVPGFHFTGIALAGEYIYSCDSWKKTINKHNINDSLSVASTYKSPGDNPSGLYYDGKYLWSCDGNTKKIYQHALDDQLTILSTYESLSRFPVGVVKVEGTLWYAGVGGILYGHLLQDGFRMEKSLALTSTKDSAQVSAFAMNQGKVIIAYEGVNKLFERDLSDLPNAPK